MITYNVFYENQRIGKLEIENGKHKYTPDEEGIMRLENFLSIFPELFVKTEWQNPIPLFENRLKDAKRFGVTKEVGNQTDGFKLILEG